MQKKPRMNTHEHGWDPPESNVARKDLPPLFGGRFRCRAEAVGVRVFIRVDSCPFVVEPDGSGLRG